jgi:hypothetical protein
MVILKSNLSKFANNIPLLVNYINESSIVRYKANVKLIVASYDSNEDLEKIIQRNLKLNNRIFIHTGPTSEVELWCKISSKIKQKTSTTPVLFSISSTGELVNRTPNVYRLTPNDKVHIRHFLNFVNTFNEEVQVLYNDTTFGRYIFRLILTTYPDASYTKYKNINNIVLEENKNVIFIGNEDDGKKLIENNLNLNIKYFFYEFNPFEVPDEIANNVYFSIYSGLLVDKNRYRSVIMDNFKNKYDQVISPYDLSFIDIINCLSYMTLSLRQDPVKMVELITSYGKYSGDISFDIEGDRNDHSFTIRNYKNSIYKTYFISDIINISSIKESDNFEYIIQNNIVFEIERRIYINSELITWKNIKIIDIYGNSRYKTDLDVIEDVEPIDSIYLDNDEYVCYVSPSYNSSSTITSTLYVKNLNKWYHTDSSSFNYDIIFSTPIILPLDVGDIYVTYIDNGDNFIEYIKELLKNKDIQTLSDPKLQERVNKPGIEYAVFSLINYLTNDFELNIIDYYLDELIVKGFKDIELLEYIKLLVQHINLNYKDDIIFNLEYTIKRIKTLYF